MDVTDEIKDNLQKLTQTVDRIEKSVAANHILLLRICQRLEVQDQFHFEQVKNADDFRKLEQRLQTDAVFACELVNDFNFLKCRLSYFKFQKAYVESSCKNDLRRMLDLLFDRNFLAEKCTATKRGDSISIKSSRVFENIIVGRF